MAIITLLDQSTINKIAAGEVVERPAAVVKELVENAIDAGANAITVEIKEGGISFIRITDNGQGIRKDDVSTAFLRHATSKIKSVEDLLSVSSLGFRGEALSSIAAVSLVELVTKHNDDLLGTRYLIEGGVEKSKEEIGCPEGTTFVVRNLFYNTPARRKFLKSPVTESGYISDLVERMAISHPNISFKFLNNNQLKLTTSGNNKLKDIIYQIYGREVAKNILEVFSETEKVSMEGYIGTPTILRGNRNYENYFINGRYIKSPVINKAIEDAYKPYVMNHKYPFTSLHFTIDPLLIDVNVHPTKMELRLRNSEEVYSQVFHTISKALKGEELIPEVTLEQKKASDSKPIGKATAQKGPEPFEKERIAASNEALSLIHNATKEVPSPSILSKSYLLKPEVDFLRDLEKPVEIPKPIENQSSLQEMQPFSFDSELMKEVSSTAVEEVRPVEETFKQESIPEKDLKQLELFEERFINEEKKPDYKIIGQLFDTYWIIEFNQKMLIVDQHVAHEKVLYEKILKDYDAKETLSQGLLPPIILSLNPREEDALKRNMPVFTDLGFEIEHFGGKEYAVRAVPADLYGLSEKSLFIELIDSLVEEEHKDAPMLVLEKVASMSCKAAVKGNQTLTKEEFSHLLNDLMTLDNPYFCPHGRPIIVAMTKYEVEKKFKRIL